jgi:signal peptidase
MAPAIPLGALVAVAPTDPSSIEIGDVVTIRADNGAVITHRVVEIDDSESVVWLRLKGDANDSIDAAPVPFRMVVGTVTAIVPFAGYLVGALTLPSGVAAVVAWFVALSLAMWLLDASTDDRRDGAAVARPERDGRLVTE